MPTPCPFCSGNRPLLTDWSANTLRVMCVNCGACSGEVPIRSRFPSGPVETREQAEARAWAEWERRA